MHLAASQVRLCFGEAMSHVFVARFAPAPRSAKARFCRQKRVALTGGGLAALGGYRPNAMGKAAPPERGLWRSGCCKQARREEPAVFIPMQGFGYGQNGKVR